MDLNKTGWFVVDSVLIYKSSGFAFNRLPNPFTFFDFDNVIIDYAPDIRPRSVTLDYTDNLERMPEIFIVVSNKGTDLMSYDAAKRRARLGQIRRIFDEAGRRFKSLHEQTEYLILLPMDDIVWAKPMPTIWEVLIRPYIENRRAIYVGDAAGRMGDFAVSDRSFVWNINRIEGAARVKFKTPEEYFRIPKKPTINNISGQRRSFPDEKLAEYIWDPSGFYPFRGLRESRPRIKSKTQIIFLIGPPNAGQETFCLRFKFERARNAEEAKALINAGKRVAIGAINKTSQTPFKSLGEWQNVLIDLTVEQYWHYVQQRYYREKLQKIRGCDRILAKIGTETSNRFTTIADYVKYERRRSWEGPVEKWRPEILSGLMFDPKEWDSNWHKQENIRPLGRSSKK